MLLCELAAVGLVVFSIVTAPEPTKNDWFRFGVLLLSSTVHLQLTRRQEERRRSRKPTVQIDLAGIWSFAAAMVLPMQFTLLIILSNRIQRWVIARRPLHRFTFSSASLVLAAMATHAVARAFGTLIWNPQNLSGSFGLFGVLLLAAMANFASAALVISVGILLLSDRPTVRTVLGTKEDNELEVITISLGAVAAVLLVTLPAALAVIVMISVIGNRIAEIRQLQVDVRTDPKTGLLNMRGWREVAEREMARASKDSLPVALLMIDLDHFKSINDTWGHPAGDDVLEYVSHALRSVTRPSDVIGRFGGEEFVLLLPDMDVHEASAAGERIRRTISELRVPTTDKRGGPVAIAERTTSIGVAVFPMHAAELDPLVQAADAAVYEAKENGRDQVRLAS